MAQVQRRPLGLLGGTLVTLLLAVAILAPVLAPYDATEFDSGSVLTPPGAAHLLGTDNLGRDGLSRMV